MVGSGEMWVVGSLATARLCWDRSRYPPPPTTTTSFPSGGVRRAHSIATAFGSAPTPGRALRGTRAGRINGIDCKHVDLQRRELGASARLQKKKLSGINKQTDRLGEHRKSSLLLPARCLYPCYILPIHLFKSSSSHSLTACLAVLL